jgi:D-lactate dehydrogenase (cytochrome)
MVSHAGDGNFHLLYVLDPDSASELEAAKRLNDRLIERALAMDGTCTGEHGIGCGKMASLAKECGTGIDVMRAIKHALDPDNRMNPGKIVEL